MAASPYAANLPGQVCAVKYIIPSNHYPRIDISATDLRVLCLRVQELEREVAQLNRSLETDHMELPE